MQKERKAKTEFIGLGMPDSTLVKGDYRKLQRGHVYDVVGKEECPGQLIITVSDGHGSKPLGSFPAQWFNPILRWFRKNTQPLWLSRGALFFWWKMDTFQKHLFLESVHFFVLFFILFLNIHCKLFLYQQIHLF